MSLAGPVLVFLLLIGNPFNPLITALAAAGAALVLLAIAFVQRRFRAVAGSLVISAAAAALFVTFGQESPADEVRPRQAAAAKSAARREGPKPAAEPADSYLKTAFYNLHITEYRGRIRRAPVLGGALTRIGNRYLLATGDGRLFAIARDPKTSSLSIDQIAGRVPLNSAEFADATDDDVATKWFRVADVLAQETAGKVRLFASHHFWEDAEKCVVLRVSEADGARDTILDDMSGLKWRTVFESTPCLPIKHRSNPFAGHQVGGRLAQLGPQELLLSVGDQEFDGFNADLDLPQDRKASYGKTILLHLDRGTSEMYSLGHRNPQGLYVDKSGAIWLTEHGPNGGDELNLIQRGANYGWPLVTYGTDYDALVWPLSRTQGDHAGYTEPIFSWLPSIAVSALIGIEGNLFPVWKGDLLMGTLKTRSLWRIRVRKGRVEFVEPLPIGRKIRDLIEMEDSGLLLWTDDYSLIDIERASGTENGELAFQTSCQACHSGEEVAGIGPDLGGVVGRRVASLVGFQYSKALKGLGGVWSEDRLDEFLANPRAMAPETTMQLEGIKDTGVRKSIIVHLKSLK